MPRKRIAMHRIEEILRLRHEAGRSQREIASNCGMAQSSVHKAPALPPDERDQLFPPDIRSWVMLLGRMAGWRPSKRRPLPGNEVLWRAYVQMQGMLRFWQATRAP